MIDTKHPAEALAEQFEADHEWLREEFATRLASMAGAAEILRTIPAFEAEQVVLRDEVDGLNELVIRQGDILRDVVIAVRGQPPENTRF